MFNRTFPIVFRLNRIYKDINIETILCSNYENIKAYCSKEFSRVKHINPIIWSKNNSLKLAQSDKVLDSAKKSVLKTAMIVELKELLTLYIKNCNSLGIPYGIAEMNSDIIKIDNGDIPNFIKNSINEFPNLKTVEDLNTSINVLTISNEKLNTTIEDLNTIIINKTNLINILQGDQLHTKSENNNLKIALYNSRTLNIKY